MGDFSKKKKNCFAPLCLSLGLKKPGDFTVSEGHRYPLVSINSLRSSVRDRARVHHRRPTGPGSTLPNSRILTDRACRGGCRARFVTEGRLALWCPARVERAWPFSGSQHGRCEHGRFLVSSTGGAWPRGGALRCCRREKRRRRIEERREERF